MAAFDIDLQYWPSLNAFAAYLQSVPRPAWCRGITHHNTLQPNDTNWAGMTSMQAMYAYYRDVKEWPSGPNLFLAARCPNPADRGIYQMTPIARPGTHAGACNASHLGIESVGDFDKAPPSADQYTLLITVTLLIMQAWGLPPASVNVHNECMTGRTCPGKYLTGTQIRETLNSKPVPITKRYRVKHRYITQRQEDNGPPIVRELIPGEELVVDKMYSNHRVHIADGSGFADLADLEAI